MKKPSKPRWKVQPNNLFAAFMIVLAMFTLNQAYQQRRVTNCQAEVNQQFQAAIQARAEVSKEDNQLLRDLVNKVLTAKSDSETREALATYNLRSMELQQKREQNPFPDYTCH